MRRDERGVSIAEFALILPALLTFVVGIAQMGKLFFSNADMRHAVAAGARVASVWPVPEDATILAAIEAKLTKSDAAAKSTPSVTRGTDESGNEYVEIRMTYQVPLDFIFFQVGPITLNETRRVFTQMETESTTASSSSTSSTSSTSTTSASSTGGTSTSASSTGGTSSDGSTSTSTTSTSSSWGGTTSSTTSGGTTTTSSTSSTSSTSTTSSSSGNSSGNSNGNSNGGGHGHGECKKC